MSAVLPAVLLTLCLSVCADAQVRTLAVFSGPTQRSGAITAPAIQFELQRLLTPASIDVAWRPGGKSRTEDEFELLVVGSFEGLCSVDELPVSAVIRRKTRVLGETRVSASGRVLPFFRVDCARLVGILRPALEPLSVPLRNVVFGRALARVIAHEIYHILAQATDHDPKGAAKPSFSIEDLTTDHFEFDTASLERMQATPVPTPFVRLSGALLPRE